MQRSVLKPIGVLASSLLAGSIGLVSSIAPVRAEGSVSLYPAGAAGSRANIEWRVPADGLYGGILTRRSLFKVYAQAGETILLGSSAVGVANGGTTGDILVYAPGQVTGAVGSETIPAPASAFSCNAQAVKGQITTRAQELAGPAPTAGGYIPCTFTVPPDGTGVYDVAFTGPSGFSASGDGNVTASIGTLDSGPGQGSSISGWDVTVRSNPADPATTRPGRLFTNYLTAFTGGNGRPINSTIFPVTTDGYRYQTAFKGVDPNGFVAFGNRRGFLDTNGQPLYRDVIAQPGSARASLIEIIEGGATMARPEFPIFFNQVDPTVLTALNIPTSPVLPIVSNLQFTGTATGATSTQNTGGTFAFTTNVPGSYELVISSDGVDFDPANPLNRVIRQQLGNGGNQSVSWDGKRNDGTFFPISPTGQSYPVNLVLRGGEYHFPLLDAENSINGGPSFTMLNPPGAFAPGFTATTAFYDDRGYTLANGTLIGTAVNASLCPAGTTSANTDPTVLSSNPLTGYDSTTNARAYGQASGGNTNATCTGSFGDAKGLDLFTYFPSVVAKANVTIIPATQPRPTAIKSVERIADVDNSGTLTGGDRIRYTIVYQNGGTGAADSFQITDILPTGITYVLNSAIVTVAGAGTTAAANPGYNGTAANQNLLAAGASLGVNGTITVTLDATIGAVEGNIFNQANGTSPTSGFPTGGVLTDTRDGTNPGTPATSIDQSPYPLSTPTDPTGITIASPVPVINKAVRRLRDNDQTGTLTPGDDLEYIIVVRNPNPVSSISDLVVGDLIPTQLQFLRDTNNTLTIAGAPFTIASTLPTTSFNGTGLPPVALTNASTLPAGATLTLRFNARILAGASSPIANQAVANYKGDLGKAIRSDGSDSTNPGTSGSGGNPGVPNQTGNVTQANDGPEDETIIRFTAPINPVGTKSVRVVEDKDGSGSPSIGDVVEYTVIYRNTSTIANLNNFQITDPIDGSNLSFVPGSYTFAATGNGTTVVARPTFNGTTDPIATNLGDPIPVFEETGEGTGSVFRQGILAAGGSVTVTFQATITAPANTVIRNQASATAAGIPISPIVTDAISGPQDIAQIVDDGANTGNGSATGDDEPNLFTVRLPGDARIKLLKRITGASRNGSSILGLNFSQSVEDSPIATDLSNAGITAFGLPEITALNPLRTGDEVEYTVYFLSDGQSFSQNSTLCDLIPEGTTFIPNSFGGSQGIGLRLSGSTTAQTNASDLDRGSFTPALAPLPPLNGCSNPSNPNGAAIVTLGTVPNTTPNNAGFFRFRVRIN